MAPTTAEPKVDVWTEAIESGDLAMLRKLIEDGKVKCTAPKVGHAFVLAGGLNHIEALKLLLDWGVSLTAQDSKGCGVLHVAAESGATKAVQLLCERGANVSATDASMKPPIFKAIQNRNFEIVRELLHWGAEIPSTEVGTPGLAEVVRKCQLERLSMRMKSQADVRVSDDQICGAEEEVIRAQKLHLSLLQAREESAGGRIIRELDEEISERREAIERGERLEAALAGEVSDKKVLLMKYQVDLHDANKELLAARTAEDSLRSEDSLLVSELMEKRSQLENAQAEEEQRELAKAHKQEALQSASEEVQEFEKSLAKARFQEADLKKKLKLAIDELAERQVDRVAAAKLTAQAQEVLDRRDST